MGALHRVFCFRVWRVAVAFALVVTGLILVSCGSLFIPATGGVATDTPVPVQAPDSGNFVNLKSGDGQDVIDGVIHITGTSLSDDYDHKEYRIDPCDTPQWMIAWAPGYKTSAVLCNGVVNYDISLLKLNTMDNAGYTWIPAGIESDGGPKCAGCHTGQRSSFYNEFTEWRKSGHAKVLSGRYFETVYLGTNLTALQGPATVRDIIDDHLVRHAPEENGDYHGPGYKLDFPAKYGNCAYCHVPAAVNAAQTDVDLAKVFSNPGDSAREGVTCDVCHKVLGIELGDNGYPYVDRPGILSFQFLRSQDAGELFAVGSLTNFIGETGPTHSYTCSPVFSKSEFCAACHYGVFSNMLIYGSYYEWRHSSYGGDPASASYQTCQDCHMSFSHSVITDSKSSQRQACSANNTAYYDFDHNMLNFGKDGAGNDVPLMIKDAATISANFNYDPAGKNWLTVTTTVQSQGVGHRFPTDSPLRHLILVIEAKDDRNQLLSQVAGEQIPIWGGTGDPAFEDPNIKFYAGLPGRIFANLLVEKDTNISPAIAYWNETDYAWVGDLGKDPNDKSDTRLLPDTRYTTGYSFDVPARGDVTVTIQLIYRYAFYDLMKQKGWNRPDIVVTSKEWLCTRSNNPTDFDCQPK